MDISKLNLTQQQITKNNLCHKQAQQYFGITGTGLVLHHKDIQLRHNDIERYIEWRPEDLVVMTNSEHTALHKQLDNSPRHTAPHTEETKKKLSVINSMPCICVETNIIYSSAKEASKQTNISQGNISACCRGDRKTAGGYHWQKL